jgi:F0F1-type ATP synthase membrane subunit c/vacuolar-type H+-ATPase subunit K
MTDATAHLIAYVAVALSGACAGLGVGLAVSGVVG